MNSPKSDQNSWSAIGSSSKLLKVLLAIVAGFTLSFGVYIWTGGDYVNDDWNDLPVILAAITAVAPVVYYAFWYMKQRNKQKNKDA